MFFDSAHFFEFERRCRAAGFTVPIIPGIKVLKNRNQLRSVPRTFHIDFPNELVAQVMQAPEQCESIGCQWAQKQVEELLQAGHNNVHFYVMNDAHLVRQVIEAVVR